MSHNNSFATRRKTPSSQLFYRLCLITLSVFWIFKLNGLVNSVFGVDF